MIQTTERPQTVTVYAVPADIRLDQGSHGQIEHGMCAMELAAFLAGEPHSDAPSCVCPAIAEVMRTLNDAMPDDERQRLIPYVLRSIGTNTGAEGENDRTIAALDYVRANVAQGVYFSSPFVAADWTIDYCNRIASWKPAYGLLDAMLAA